MHGLAHQRLLQFLIIILGALGLGLGFALGLIEGGQGFGDVCFFELVGSGDGLFILTGILSPAGSPGRRRLDFAFAHFVVRLLLRELRDQGLQLVEDFRGLPIIVLAQEAFERGHQLLHVRSFRSLLSRGFLERTSQGRQPLGHGRLDIGARLRPRRRRRSRRRR